MVLCIQIIATVVLARLLTPRDFGLVAMVTAFSLLLLNFGLNGFTEAVIQREKIDHALASNLFWINFAAGLLLTLGFASAGPVLAWFYHDPIVERVTIGVSLTIVINSTSVLHLALLKRAMRFPATSANDIIARLASVAVSILLGFAGWGYWALVAGTITLPLAQSVGAWYLCRWVPGLPRRVAGTASMVRFALNVYGRFSVNYSARNMDNLLVGWRFGAHSLGFYKKAYDLFEVPVSQTTALLTNVAVSALSRFKRDPLLYKQNLISALAVLAFVGMGLGAELALVGKDLIRVLLGPAWEKSGRIFMFFAPGIGVMLLYYAHGWIHLSIGRADRWLRWGIIEFTFTGLLFLLALPWGPEGIAMAWTASFWILTIPAFWYAGRPIRMGVTPVVAAVWKYLLASLLAGCASALIIRGYPSFAAMPGAVGAFARIVTTTGLLGTLYIGAVILLHRGLAPVHEAVALLRDMLPWARFRTPYPTDALALAPAAVIGHARDGAQRACNTISQGAHSEPLVSILIPAYNSQEWIADTLRSALGQTWPRKEIIVVDDGSTDQTLAIARKFESEGVRVITQKNQGAAVARNLAFSFSKGDYIQWLDADDLLAPDKIAKQMEALNGCPSKRLLLSSPWGIFMYRYYRAEFVPTPLWCDLSPFEWLLRKMGQNLYMQTASWLVSRELTEAAGRWDTRMLSDDDGEYFCRVLLASKGVRFVPEAKMYYRGPGLAFRSLGYVGQSTRKLEALWLSMQLHIGYLRSLEESERVRAASLRYLQTCLIYFYPEKHDIVKQMEELASELGGQLGSPCLSWKYSWMKALFGWRLAKRGQELLLKLRWSSEKVWDKALFRLERPRLRPIREHGSETPRYADSLIA
jgi:PST family polysaccharide transporter